MTKTFRIVTLGCKVNQYETAYMEETLEAAGWQRALPDKPARLVIVNTCAVTQRAVHQSRQAISKTIRENPGATAVATGCYAQVDPQGLARMEGLCLVAGNQIKAGCLPAMIARATASDHAKICVDAPDKAFQPMPIQKFSGRARAYLKIQDGCEAFCTYCIVPYARGPYRSMPADRVLAALAALAEAGHREVVLTGIHLGKYGVDQPDCGGLTGLLEKVARAHLPLRVRLSSLEPSEIDMRLLDLAASERWLCRHFHVPLQSGDGHILRRMNRHYTPETFARLVERIHARIPAAAIGVDVMAGFPGESDEAHACTHGLLEGLPISYLHVFPFSRRMGTAAFDMQDQVPSAVIKQRAAELRALAERKKAVFYEGCVGGVFDVLAEGPHPNTPGMMLGTSDNYLPVQFPLHPDRCGEILAVKVEKRIREGLKGVITS